MKHIRDESDERVIHRLEAFSDIVIGFSLAQLGLNFIIPAHAIEIFTRPVQVVAFVITFTFVCRMWWSAHKLFTHFFVPGRLTIFLNFAALGMVVFAVYSVQLVAHGFADPRVHQDPVALMIYIGSFGVLFGLRGTQFLLGWNARRDELPPEIADRGFRDGATMLAISLAFLIGATIMALAGVAVKSLLVFAITVIVFIRVARLYTSARRRSAKTSAT